ncbi:MAG: DUF6702 family protein [bacterium]
MQRWTLRKQPLGLGIAACVAVFWGSLRHPYYISICEVDHIAQAQTLEITFKIFTDDLEEALAAQGAGKMHLGTAEEDKNAGRYIFSYLKKKVAFLVEGDSATFTYIGKEVEAEITWCYVEAKNVAAISKIEVVNRLLLERHDEQVNIVHVKADSKRKSLLLHKNRVSGTLTFP